MWGENQAAVEASAGSARAEGRAEAAGHCAELGNSMSPGRCGAGEGGFAEETAQSLEARVTCLSLRGRRLPDTWKLSQGLEAKHRRDYAGSRSRGEPVARVSVSKK